MSKNYLLNWAIGALNNNNFSQASDYYEQYAESILFQDKEGAAFHLMLAAQYEKTVLERSINLYRKSYSIYKQLNKTITCADILMAKAILYFERGDNKNAREQYRKSILTYTEFITNEMLNLDEPIKEQDLLTINDCINKIQFCLKRISLG